MITLEITQPHSANTGTGQLAYVKDARNGMVLIRRTGSQ